MTARQRSGRDRFPFPLPVRPWRRTPTRGPRGGPPAGSAPRRATRPDGAFPWARASRTAGPRGEGGGAAGSVATVLRPRRTRPRRGRRPPGAPPPETGSGAPAARRRGPFGRGREGPWGEPIAPPHPGGGGATTRAGRQVRRSRRARRGDGRRGGAREGDRRAGTAGTAASREPVARTATRAPAWAARAGHRPPYASGRRRVRPSWSVTATTVRATGLPSTPGLPGERRYERPHKDAVSHPLSPRST